MQGDHLQIAYLSQQLAQLVLLAGCCAMSKDKPRPKHLPAVTSASAEHNDTSPAQQFLQLPPHLQRQALRYAERWLDGVLR